MTVELLNIETLEPRDFKKLKSCLSRVELEKSERFHFDKDRQAFIAARGTLRRKAGTMLGIPPGDLKIGTGPFGKPYFQGAGAGIQFNVSHSANWVAWALHENSQPLGIDIEWVNPGFDYSQVVAHYFTAEEQAQIANARDFYRFWTMKEAILKITGIGLVNQINRLDLPGSENVIEPFDTHLLPFCGETYTLHIFSHPETILTLATMEAGIPAFHLPRPWRLQGQVTACIGRLEKVNERISVQEG
ncbi:MAG: 4'-phosphopantetheinyl transferase family protein [Saprospiraceae bacterium]